MKKNIIISLILGIILSALGLYLAFRNVPFAELIEYMVSIQYVWLFPTGVVVMLSFVFRVIRWQIILESTRKIGFWPAFHPLMIAFMINCILPGRVGELARPAILKKNEKVPFSTALATVAAERAFDISFIILLFMVVLLFVHIDPGTQISIGKYVLNKETLQKIVFGMVQLSFVLILGMILVSVRSTRVFINNMIIKSPDLAFFLGNRSRQKITDRICTPLVGLVDNFALGFDLIRSPRKMILCLGLSLIIWILAAFSYYVFSLGCPGIDLSFAEMTAVMVIICVFIALPSVPGYWGLWEAGGIFALTLFGISSQEAAGFTLANHAVQIFPVMIIGMFSAMITGVNIWRTSFSKDVL
jgi:uncharacterized protein (TIRG00374 family)